MSNKEIKSQDGKSNPQDNALSPEVLDMIKHPPKIDDVLRNQSPEELRNNQVLVPEMLDEPSDEMDGFTKD